MGRLSGIFVSTWQVCNPNPIALTLTLLCNVDTGPRGPGVSALVDAEPCGTADPRGLVDPERRGPVTSWAVTAPEYWKPGATGVGSYPFHRLAAFYYISRES